MSKVFIENTKIEIYEKSRESAEHVIKGDSYILESTVKNEFKADIYKYSDDESMLTSLVTRFKMQYYKLVFSSNSQSKAWNLIEVSRDLEVRVHRLSCDMFFIIGDNKGAEDTSAQFSFCRIKPSTKVEEFTTNITKLNRYVVTEKYVLVSFTITEPEEDKTTSSVVAYNFDGGVERKHYERIEHKGKVTESGSISP